MIESIRGIPKRTEFVCVILLCFGLPLSTQISRMIFEGPNYAVFFTDRKLLLTLAVEALFALLAGSLLTIRGWRLGELGLRPTWKSTGGGLLLFAVNYVLFVYLYYALSMALGGSGIWGPARTHNSVTLPVAILVSLINPFFEEIFVTGYILKALEQEGAAVAIGVSVLIRCSYHLYHGPKMIIGIFPMAVIFAAVYWKWRRLWPLVVAHALMDFISLISHH